MNEKTTEKKNGLHNVGLASCHPRIKQVRCFRGKNICYKCTQWRVEEIEIIETAA
jgi:hypothetical protein